MPVAKVVKYDGSPDVFAWKYPEDSLGTWTQLIVNESQEAVLFKGGQALDIFAAGRHTLSTANIPLLNKIINLPFSGRSPFAAEVWFVNKIHSLDIKWGTSEPIQLQDPKHNVYLPLRAHGQFGVQVAESKAFLTQLVGAMHMFDKDSLTRFFKGIYLTRVKDSISQYLIKKGVSVLEINAYLLELSNYLKESISPKLGDYGIKLINFYVNSVNVPEDDPAIIQLKAALAKRAEMDIIGYSYQQQRSFDALEGAATNPGSGSAGMMGAGMGLGMGVGVGGAFGGAFGGMAQNMSFQQMKNCNKCVSEMPALATFCPACGHDTRVQASPTGDSEPTNTVMCNSCGGQYDRSYKFCPICGDAYNPCPKCGKDIEVGTGECPDCSVITLHSCPKCGTALPENAKFCGECGESFVDKCPHCDAVLNGTQKFCFECGERIGEKRYDENR